MISLSIFLVIGEAWEILGAEIINGWVGHLNYLTLSIFLET
jgi:hypothetical protein